MCQFMRDCSPSNSNVLVVGSIMAYIGRLKKVIAKLYCANRNSNMFFSRVTKLALSTVRQVMQMNPSRSNRWPIFQGR